MLVGNRVKNADGTVDRVENNYQLAQRVVCAFNLSGEVACLRMKPLITCSCSVFLHWGYDGRD